MSKIGRGLILLLILLSLSPSSWARRRSLSPWSFKNNFEIYLLGNSTTISDSALNPDNRYLSIPQKTATLEFREDLTISYMDATRFVLRPRLILDTQEIRYTNPFELRTKMHSRPDLTDAFAETQWMDSFSTTIGLQVYQWGPAELISPSNPIYHFNTSQRSFFYKEKGHVLARANLTFGNLSVVGLGEVTSNNEPYWIADKKFSPQMLVKTEWRFENPSNYVGVVLGQQEQNHGFVGEYLVFYPAEGFSVYLDSRQTQGITTYQPVPNGFNGYDLEEDEDLKKQSVTLTVTGLRYEGSVDFRLEYVSNPAGYDSEEFKKAKAAVTQISPNLASNVQRFGRSGLELPGKNYLYASARFTEFLSIRDFNFYLRYLLSLQDSSGSFQTGFDKVMTDAMVFYFEGSASQGEQDSELTLLNRLQLTAGMRWTF